MKKLNKWFEDRNINYKKYIILFYVIFVMAPVIVVLSYNNNGQDIFARTLASVMVLVFFVLFFIYDFRKKVAADLGLRDMTVTVDPYAAPNAELKLSKTAKIIATYDLDAVFRLVETNIREDITFDILLLNPYSEFAELSVKKEEYFNYADKFEKLARMRYANINLKFYSLMPCDNLIILDEDIYDIPMTHKLKNGNKQFVTHYRGRKTAYAKYRAFFNTVWEHPVYEITEGENE